MRTRGELLLYLKSAAAASNGFTGAFGIGLTTSQAFAIGVTAMPGPITDIDWDGWLYHRVFTMFSGDVIASVASTDSDIVNANSAVLKLEVDSKAMRKQLEGMTEFCMLETIEAGTGTMQWIFNSRTLLALA